MCIVPSMNVLEFLDVWFFRYVAQVLSELLLILLLLLYLLSPSFSLFTIMYVKQTLFLGYAHTVVTVLYLEFVPQIVLFRVWNMFCTLTLVFFKVCVQCPIWLFFCCCFLVSCFHNMLLRYCPSDFEMVPVAPILLLYNMYVSCHRHFFLVLLLLLLLS